MEQIAVEIGRIALKIAVLESIAFLASMAVLYFVVKAAVRNGVNESKIGNAFNSHRWSEVDDWSRQVEVARMRDLEQNIPPASLER